MKIVAIEFSKDINPAEAVNDTPHIARILRLQVTSVFQTRKDQQDSSWLKEERYGKSSCARNINTTSNHAAMAVAQQSL